MFETLTPYLVVASYIFTIGIAAGAVHWFRGAMAKSASETQDRVINALNAEISSMKDHSAGQDRRIGELEKENARQAQIIGIIKAAFKKRGIAITIDGDMVSISDSAGNSHEARITGQITLNEAS